LVNLYGQSLKSSVGTSETQIYRRERGLKRGVVGLLFDRDFLPSILSLAGTIVSERGWEEGKIVSGGGRTQYWVAENLLLMDATTGLLA
jgi:hypothetical protein